MAALTDCRKTPYRIGDVMDYAVSPTLATTIYEGALVATSATGAVPAAVAAGVVLGRAERTVTPAEAAEGVRIPVRRGVLNVAQTGLTIADVGNTVYATDDQTVGKTGTANIAGVLVDIDSDGAWVRAGL